MLKIDCQSHVFPREYVDFLKRNPHLPQARELNKDELIIHFNGDFQMKIVYSKFNIERKIEDMNRAKINVSVLSCNMPGPCMLHPSLSIEAARVINDYIAEIMQKYPDYFIGLASIPWQIPEEAVKEIERACCKLGLRGVVLYSHIGGIPVDNPTLEPVYDYLENQGIPIVIHPTVPIWASAINKYSMITMMGLQIDASFALLRLILSGVLERHPNLKVVMPHAGGVLPYMIGRIDHQTEILQRGRDNIKHPPSYYLKRVYFDLVSPSAQVLKFCCEFAGTDRLLFGTDHPWVDPMLFIELIEGLNLSNLEKEKIYSMNAIHLFRISL